MRRIFIVVAKLFGLFQVFWAITYLCSMLPFIGHVEALGTSRTGQIIIQLLSLAVFLVLTLIMVRILLLRTEWLADKLRIPPDDSPINLSNDKFFRTGIQLIGIYILVTSIPNLVQKTTIAYMYHGYTGNLTMSLLRTLIPAVLKISLALILAVRTNWIQHLVERGEKTRNKQLLASGIALLVVLFLLGRGLTLFFSHEPFFENSPVSSVPARCEPVIIADDTNEYSNPFLVPSPPPTNAEPALSAGIAETVEFLRGDEETDQP
jgi:hypothetical protein